MLSGQEGEQKRKAAKYAAFFVLEYTVYILHSSQLNRYYTGSTDDVERRLAEHNTGKYKGGFTTKGIPWVLYLTIDGLSSKQAYEIESHIKKMKSRK